MENVTENGALSYNTSTDHRLNLFFKTVRDLCEFPYGSDRLFDLIENSWSVNPLDTMKIIMNWRDCRGGKGDRDGPLSALIYIENNYTEWFNVNFKIIHEYGSWLDLIKLWHFVSKDAKDLIMDYIIDTLENDVKKMENESVSLLAKWIPSENSKWDRFSKPRFVLELCRNLFHVEKVTGEHIRILRKIILTPLRKKIDIVETRICQRQPVDYEKVPSVAMNKYKHVFLSRDATGFKEFLTRVKSGESKINAGQLFPHDLVKQYLHGSPEDPVIEEQWRVIKEKFVFTNAIAVCDVSGSMDGTPMEVAIALGLLCLCNNRLITFSEIPELHFVPDGSLHSQVQNVKNMIWGSNTNFEGVMNLVLGLSTNIERVYVFSDMQFDQAMGYTNMELMKKKFIQANMKMPQIVFWNLRGSTKDYPAICTENVVMLSGYSPSLLNSITSTDINPLNVMLQIIRSPRYDLIISP